MEEPERKLGPYTLVSKIGRGAFGVVWLAEKRSAIATTRFALKLPRDEDIDLEAFKHEATIWLQASGHPNVVPMIEADIYDEQIVIVSEYVTEGSLASWIGQHGGRAPSIEAASELTEGILSGLAHLHARKIIHRDLKPDNILLQNETPRLADFGIARLLKSGSYSTNVSGTLAYMAPEAFDGKRNEQTDVWSAGVIFYQLLSGSLPYAQSDMAAFVGALMRYDPAPLPDSVPEVLRQVVMKALQRDPLYRYATAKEMRHDLREAEHKLWQGEQRPPTVEPVSTPPNRISQPTVPYPLPAETEKYDPAVVFKSKENLPPPVVKPKRKSYTPFVLAGIVGILFLGTLLSLGIYGVYRWVTNKTIVEQSSWRFALKQTLTGHTSNIYSVTFSPDGKTIASSSTDKTVKLWDAQSGALKQTLTGHTGVVWSVTYSPDGKTIATGGGDDNTVRLWDANTATLKQTLTGHTVYVRNVRFSPDGKTLASCADDKTVKLWDAQTGALKQTLTGHSSSVNTVAYSPDGTILASGSDDKYVKLWDAQTGALKLTITTGHTGWVWLIAFSPDGKTLASASSDKTAKVWDTQTGQLKQTLTGFDGSVNSVAFSPGGKTLATASNDKTIKTWDTESWALKQTLTSHTDIVWSVAFSPDGKSLVSGGKDNAVKVWQVQ